MSFAGFIKVIITAFKPLTVFLSVSTRFLLKALGLKPSDEPPVTEEEVRVLLEQGRLHGVFNVGEQKMIENVFELDDLRVSEIMTPRTKITWLDVNDPLYKHLEVIAEKQYSCYVVAEEDLEHVLGVVYTKRFLADVLGATGASMRSSVQQPLYVPEGMYTQKLLDMFKDTRIKVALVMDEFGGLAGMVTLRDIIEHLVGDLPSYDEEFKQEIVEREDGSWLVDGLLPISEFKDFLDLDELPLEEKRVSILWPVSSLPISGISRLPATTSCGMATASRSSIWTAPASTKYWSKNCRKRKLQRQMQRTNKQNNKAPAAGRGFNFIQTLFLKFKGCGTV